MANFFSASYWKARFFKAFSRTASDSNPGSMSATLTGSGGVSADLVAEGRRNTIDLEFVGASEAKAKSGRWIRQLLPPKVEKAAGAKASRKAKERVEQKPARAPTPTTIASSESELLLAPPKATTDDEDEEDLILALLLTD